MLPEERNACALYSEWAKMWTTARAKAPKPHSSIMKPICAMVEYARARLMLVCVSITTEPNRAVAAPTRASVSRTRGLAAKRGLRRTTRNPPALMIPACIRAETGVGVSMVSGSQPWNGSCADLSNAAAPSNAASQPTSVGTTPVRICSTRANNTVKSEVPKIFQLRKSAPAMHRSPMRLMTNFLRAA